MTGPQGPDPTQPWQPPGPDDDQSTGEQPMSPWHPDSTWQPPAYTPSEYPQYPPPPAQFYPQYPQPGQYPPQPGPYGPYPPQPGQFGPYPPPPGPYGPPAAASKRSIAVIGTVIGVFAAVVIAVVLVLGFWAPGFFVTTKLDIGKAQAGVQQVLTDETNGYGAKNVKDVKCNKGQNPTVKKGGTFECDVSIDGAKRQVTVTFQDSKGTYEVGRPK